MPADFNPMATQNGTFLGSEKTFVLLKRSVDAMPGIGCFTVAVRDAVEPVENAAVMRRMDLWIVIQTSSNNPISAGRIDMMEDFIGPISACWRGLIQPFVVISDDVSFADREISMMAGLIAPAKGPGGARLT